jgi:hypothetical protein
LFLYSSVSPRDTAVTGGGSAANTIVAVSRQGTWALAALLAALLSVVALAACGDSDSSPGSSSTGDSTEASPRGSGEESGKNGGEAPSKPGQGTEDGGSDTGASVPTSPLKVSGGGSAQFRVKDGDNSIQDFGEEGSEAELEEAAIALHEFLVARAEEDWRTACARLSQTVKAQLTQLASREKQAGSECPQILARLTPPLPAAVERETTIVDAGSLRHEDEGAFLIYRGMEGTVYAILMAEEDGWKVGGLAPVPLS